MTITVPQRTQLVAALTADGDTPTATAVELCGAFNGDTCDLCAELYDMVINDEEYRMIDRDKARRALARKKQAGMTPEQARRAVAEDYGISEAVLHTIDYYSLTTADCGGLTYTDTSGCDTSSSSYDSGSYDSGSSSSCDTSSY